MFFYRRCVAQQRRQLGGGEVALRKRRFYGDRLPITVSRIEIQRSSHQQVAQRGIPAVVAGHCEDRCSQIALERATVRRRLQGGRRDRMLDQFRRARQNLIERWDGSHRPIVTDASNRLPSFDPSENRVEPSMEYKAIVSDDVTELILDDHATFRRLFARIDETDDPDKLGEIWSALGPLLHAHAVAEEDSFYPALLAAAKDDDDVLDAIKDHNEIRDAANEADRYSVGSAAWHAAVTRARDANNEHMGEEERGPLPAARRSMNIEQRISLGLEFLRLRNAYPSGRTGADDHDKDPGAYVREHRE